MPPRKLYFENTRVGDELPAMARAPIDRVQIARYAAATGDFSPTYVDEVAARGLGMPSVLAPPSLAMGFLGQLVTEWTRGAQVKRLSVKFVRVLWPGDTLICRGRVSDRHGQDGRYAIDLDVWAENQKGELVVRGAVTLKVFYSVEDENRFRAGQPPLIVNVPRESILTATPPATAAAAPRGGSSAKKPAPPKPAPPTKATPKKPAARAPSPPKRATRPAPAASKKARKK